MFVAINVLYPTATAKHREVVIEVTLECVEVLKNKGQMSESVLGTRNQGSITHRLAAGTYVYQTPSIITKRTIGMGAATHPIRTTFQRSNCLPPEVVENCIYLNLP